MREVWHPRPSQAGMLSFAETRERLAWWATMGAGKSAAALEWARRECDDKFAMDQLLVVGPRIVAAQTWPREAAKWAHSASLGPVRVLGPSDLGFERTWDVLDGPGGLKLGDWRAARKRISGCRERVHTVSWDNLHWLVKALGPASRYTHVILDESTYAAEHTSKRWRAARYLTSKLGCTHILELTGLPAPNGYEKLWAQAYLLDGGVRLGRTLTEFRTTWMEPDVDPARMPYMTRVYRWRPQPAKRARLDALLAELAISVQVDLGVPFEIVDHRMAVPEDAWEAYKDIDRDFVHTFAAGGVVSAANAAVKVGKLLQAAQGSVYDDLRQVRWLHDVKLERLEEILDSATGGVLLAYPFIHDWDRIKRRFKVAKHINNPGSVVDFSLGRTKLLCMHPASGAHGIDSLQLGGATIVWFGLSHNYEHYAQFNARLVRPGQRETVMIHRLIMARTVEEYVADVVLPAKADEDEALRLAVRWSGADAIPD